MWGELLLDFYLCEQLCFPEIRVFVFNIVFQGHQKQCEFFPVQLLSLTLKTVKVLVHHPPSATERNTLQLEESPGSFSALPTRMHTYKAPFSTVIQWNCHHFPLFQGRQEKAQNKLPTLKWKMCLRQLIGPSPHLHIHYLCVAHLFALRQLFLIMLRPLLLENNLFNQINLKAIYVVCLHVAERKRGLKKQHSMYRVLLIQPLKHKVFPKRLLAGRACHAGQCTRKRQTYLFCGSLWF